MSHREGVIQFTSNERGLSVIRASEIKIRSNQSIAAFPDDISSCKKCGKFLRKEDLEWHLRLGKCKQSVQEGNFVCLECDSVFRCENTLDAHQCPTSEISSETVYKNIERLLKCEDSNTAPVTEITGSNPDVDGDFVRVDSEERRLTLTLQNSRPSVNGRLFLLSAVDKIITQIRQHLEKWPSMTINLGVNVNFADPKGGADSKVSRCFRVKSGTVRPNSNLEEVLTDLYSNLILEIVEYDYQSRKLDLIGDEVAATSSS